MVSNDDFDGKATNLNCFYLHINFEQKYLKPAIVASQTLEVNLHKIKSDCEYIHTYGTFHCMLP